MTYRRNLNSPPKIGQMIALVLESGGPFNLIERLWASWFRRAVMGTLLCEIACAARGTPC
jgi:hypothetical protein